MTPLRRVGIAAAIAATPVAAAYRFALAYRRRAGRPKRHPPRYDPSHLGLPFEATTVPSAGLELPAWFIPARQGVPGPGVVLVHGWESARDRTLPFAAFLNAAGFHVLAFDVRGHGANPPEVLPVSAGEFGADAAAAFAALVRRPEVTVGAIAGHSMGAAGALLAAAADPRVRAVVATSAPAGPYRLTRQTFRLARLPLPDPLAYPLAWLTTRVYLRPRGHRVAHVSATRAIAVYRGPVLLVHGELDQVVPLGHLARLERAARRARDRRPGVAPVASHVVAGGGHSWLYEDEGYRRVVAGFLAAALGGPYPPAEAAARAAAVDARRLPDLDAPLSALVDEPGGVRTLVRALRGGTRETAEESGAAGEETRASGEGTRASSEGTGAADVGGAPAAAADAGRSLRGHSPSDRPPPGPAA